MKKIMTLCALVAVGGLQAASPIIHGVPTPANLPQPQTRSTNTQQMHMAPAAVAPEHVLGDALRGLVNASYEFVRTNGSQSATEMLHHAAMNYVAHHKHIMGNSVVAPGAVLTPAIKK